MKNIVLSAVFLFMSAIVTAQGAFDKFENNESVASVIVSKKMFEMMSKVKADAKDKEAQQFMNVIKKLDNLKVFMTSNAKTANDMKATVSSYLKSNPLEELMRMNDSGRQVKIYVKSGANENIIKELLMYIEDPTSKDKQAIVMSLTGTFYLDEISSITEKLNLPGGNELKKAAKK
jgi:alpha-acetolactate decarboxylase